MYKKKVLNLSTFFCASIQYTQTAYIFIIFY